MCAMEIGAGLKKLLVDAKAQVGVSQSGGCTSGGCTSAWGLHKWGCPPMACCSSQVLEAVQRGIRPLVVAPQARKKINQLRLIKNDKVLRCALAANGAPSYEMLCEALLEAIGGGSQRHWEPLLLRDTPPP